jgi:hypothetical protein
MKNWSYVEAIKSILVCLGIVVTKFAYLGRNLWEKLPEMLKEESTVIQMMENWNLLLQSSCYLAKLPMQEPICKLAGFTDANGM